jgi:hypothetical protein
MHSQATCEALYRERRRGVNVRNRHPPFACRSRAMSTRRAESALAPLPRFAPVSLAAIVRACIALLPPGKWRPVAARLARRGRRRILRSERAAGPPSSRALCPRRSTRPPLRRSCRHSRRSSKRASQTSCDGGSARREPPRRLRATGNSSGRSRRSSAPSSTASARRPSPLDLPPTNHAPHCHLRPEVHRKR